MKNIFIHLALSFVYIDCCAATDSLPACINTMKISAESFVREYEYKGQRWFVFTKVVAAPEPDLSDKITTTKFYNSNCKLVCTWTKGGITGMNKVIPDTIEKVELKKIEIVPKDTAKKHSGNTNALPDTIVKMALVKNIQEVKEYLYRDKILYMLLYSRYSQPPTREGSVTIDIPYYDEHGTVIIIYKRAIRSTFSRAERWVPASVERSDVSEVKNGVWTREKNTYKKLSTAYGRQ